MLYNFRENLEENQLRSELGHRFWLCLLIDFWTSIWAIIYLNDIQTVLNVIDYPLAEVKLIEGRKIKSLIN